MTPLQSIVLPLLTALLLLINHGAAQSWKVNITDEVLKVAPNDCDTFHNVCQERMCYCSTEWSWKCNLQKVNTTFATKQAHCLCNIRMRQKQTDNEFKAELYGRHNEFRTWHESPKLMPDPHLEKDAQSWADELAKEDREHEDAHAKQETENTAVTKCSVDGREPAEDWYREFERYNFEDKGKSIGAYKHFTAMIWKRSRKIGCARAKSKKEVYTVCRYSPKGNVGNQTSYTSNVLPRKTPIESDAR